MVVKPDRIPRGFAAGSSAGDHRSLTFHPLTQNVSWWRGSEQGRLPDTPRSKTQLGVTSQALSYRFSQSQWLAFSASSENSFVDLLSVAPRSPRFFSRHDVDLPTKPLAPTSTGYSLTLHPLSLRTGLHTSPSFSRRKLPVPPPMALSAQPV